MKLLHKSCKEGNFLAAFIFCLFIHIVIEYAVDDIIVKSFV